MQKEIAVRLYQNAKYGTTYAKGVRHQALFNAPKLNMYWIFMLMSIGSF